MQVKLLRVLQERTIRPVGGTQETPVDVRVIAATNRDLREMIANGTFREDLYYRVSVIPIQVPALRERREDVELLANHFLKKYSTAAQKSILRISQESLAARRPLNGPATCASWKTPLSAQWPWKPAMNSGLILRLTVRVPAP